MPVRLMAEHLMDIDPARYRWSDGVGPCPYFGTPGHLDDRRARDQWARCRRQVWAETFRFCVPVAAVIFDGLSDSARPLLWRSFTHTIFDPGPVRAALQQDRRRVERFTVRDLESADPVGDFLAQRLSDLAVVEQCVDVLAALASDPLRRCVLGIAQRITSAHHYGEQSS
jgi:hypothetical protein